MIQRSSRYILDEGGNPKLEPDLYKWAMWFERHGNRILQQDTIGDVLVSTVFLALDADLLGLGPPLLWETMIFRGGGEFDSYQQRYHSQEAALKGHAEAVAMVRSKRGP